MILCFKVLKLLNIFLVNSLWGNLHLWVTFSDDVLNIKWLFIIIIMYFVNKTEYAGSLKGYAPVISNV